jgi:hypothetical protein
MQEVFLEASKYIILGASLFCITNDGLLLRCIDNTTTQRILKQIHGSKNLGINKAVTTGL